MRPKDWSKVMLKKYLMFGGLIGGMIISSHAKAYGDLFWQPRVGMQYEFSNYSSNASWGEFLPKKFNHYGVSFGAKVHNLLGFDLTYMFSAEKKNKTSLAAGSTFLGAAVGGASVGYTNSVKMNYVGVDINGYIPFNDNLSLFIAPGVSIGTPKLTLTADTPSNMATAIAQLQGKMKMVPRVTVGLEYVESDVGVKTFLRWINASKMKLGQVNTNVLNDDAERPFKDSMSLGINVYIRV